MVTLAKAIGNSLEPQAKAGGKSWDIDNLEVFD
jgi:hypothetical protein